jgi:hypothetical protein
MHFLVYFSLFTLWSFVVQQLSDWAHCHNYDREEFDVITWGSTYCGLYLLSFFFNGICPVLSLFLERLAATLFPVVFFHLFGLYSVRAAARRDVRGRRRHREWV